MENNTKNSHENYQIISEILKKQLKDDKVVFVFPTEITARSWAEKALFLTPQKAVQINRFIAWDSFKGTAIRSVKQEYDSIPSLLRKLFVQNLLEKNLISSEPNTKDSPPEPFFSSLIPREFADYAPSFSSWLAGLLPQLARFKAQFEKISKTNTSLSDDESQDLLKLEKIYSEFLENNKLFEPAWEKPPFHNDGNFYYVFFPDIANDFDEYKAILEKTENVKIIFSPTREMVQEKLKVKEFDNAREEIRFLSLEIEALIKKGINYSSIAIHLPEEKEISVYVERELSLRNIPFQVRSGKALSLYGAGSFFTSIADAAINSFSFSTIKKLLSNKSLPWSDDSKILIPLLFEFGIKNNCLCSYEDSDNKNNPKLIDTWLEAFKIDYDERLYNFYTQLKKHILLLSEAKEFSQLREAYFKFRNTFFDMDNCTEESDLILSRCITELISFTRLEEKYKEMRIEKPLGFFCTHLDNTEYLAQQKLKGVHILPYKTAVAAAYDYHFVINAGQKQLSIVHQPLSFLLQTKKDALEIKDSNVTEKFIHLYCLGNVAFSYSKKGFAHYSLPHTSLEKIRDEKIDKTLLNTDSYLLEKNIFLENQKPAYLYPKQKEGFDQWIKAKPWDKNDPLFKKFILDEKMYLEILEKLKKSDTGKLKVSATSLKEFFFCPQRFLYKKIYALENEKLSTDLISAVFLGEIYHKILEEFFSHYKETNERLPQSEKDLLVKSYDPIIQESLEKVFTEFPQNVFPNKKLSPLTIEFIKNQAEAYKTKTREFITFFLLRFAGSQVLDTEVWLEETEHDEYYISGQVDLVLKQDNGEVWIIDFKTGGTPKRSDALVNDEGEMSDFQLTLYLRLYEKTYKKQVQGLAFCSINQISIYPIMGVLEKNEEVTTNPYYKSERVYRNLELYPDEILNNEKAKIIDFNKSLEALDRYIKSFSQKILENEFALDKEIPFSSCISCDYKKICRTTYAVSGDVLAAQSIRKIKKA